MVQKNKKYVTISEGIDFRSIAKIMSNHGFKMNHATARNVLFSAIKHIVVLSADKIGTRISDEQMDSIVRDQNLHMALADVLFLAHKAMKEDEKKGKDHDSQNI